MKQIYTIHLLIKASSKIKCNELENKTVYSCVFLKTKMPFQII